MRILVLLAHPRLRGSIVISALAKAIDGLQGVTVRDLYAEYPDFAVDVRAEQDSLLAHDLIVLQHPFYWYSAPALVKEWQDLVLESGWAYGRGGTRLHGKFMMQAISTGGAESYYAPGGRNRYAIEELLRPFDQTAHLCGMAYLRPFVVYEGRRMTGATLGEAADRYRELISGLASGAIDPLSTVSSGYPLPAAFTTGART